MLRISTGPSFEFDGLTGASYDGSFLRVFRLALHRRFSPEWEHGNLWYDSEHVEDRAFCVRLL